MQQDMVKIKSSFFIFNMYIDMGLAIAEEGTASPNLQNIIRWSNLPSHHSIQKRC
jgi:hypothetical protein